LYVAHRDTLTTVMLRLFGIALIAFVITAAPAHAQRVADLRPVGLVRYRPSEAPRLSIPRVAEESKRHHLWPWFVVGGALVGGGTVLALTAKNCDSGCQDDGAWGFSIPYAVAAAGVGAAVGGVLGAIVDLSRSDTAVGPSSRE
jgi:hypothetical protein